MNRKRFITLAVAIVAGCLAAWLWHGRHRSSDSYLVYDRGGSNSVIVVPQTATNEELAAAQLISTTLAKAAGVAERQFPVQRESWWRFWQRGIYVGATTRSGLLSLPGQTRLEQPVGYKVMPAGVVLSSRWREDIVGAAGWFLEKQLGAHWYIPGPLGESVLRREKLQLTVGEDLATPSFVSRNLGGLDTPEEQRWYAANGLRAVIAHGHSMSTIFQPTDVVRYPDLAPLINWQKYFPTRPDEQEWQPNLTAEVAPKHASSVLRAQLIANPEQVAVRLCMNDSIRYDQSKATLDAVGAPEYFRMKPNYSNLVFGFANKVARELQQEFPDRFVSTYAYDWTENVPSFRVEPNVVPYLTADRSQWFDPAFAAEDRDLMKRWVAAGPKVVGIYDYYEGAPFIVPRPTLYAVTQSIPYAYEAGVRAFYAESYTNWGIDGPKLWLAAQLLWDAKRDPQALLATYYREYWQEAAGPMREFFDGCDRQWLEQPLPSYWLKYFKDEHQALRFPPEVRRELRAKLDAARALVRQDVVRARLELTSAAFAVTEAFCDYCEARDHLSRLALVPTLDGAAVMAAAQQMQSTAKSVKGRLRAAETQQPLTMRAKLMEEYTRNDPRRRAFSRLRQDAGLDLKLTAVKEAFGDLNLGAKPATSAAQEMAVDGGLKQLRLRDVTDFTSLNWVQSGLWLGHGEPYQTRRISLLPEGDAQAIRFVGCKQETLSQWHAAGPAESEYLGTVKVRAKVSPGNMTFLIITFLDEKGKYIGIGSIDRLPVGEWSETVELAVLVKAPKNAKQVGLGVRVLNQVNSTSPDGSEEHGDDYAEFSGLSLKRL